MAFGRLEVGEGGKGRHPEDEQVGEGGEGVGGHPQHCLQPRHHRLGIRQSERQVLALLVDLRWHRNSRCWDSWRRSRKGRRTKRGVLDS